MNRYLGMILLAVLCPTCFAGTSAVTATITDSDGQTWNNGLWSATLNSPNGPPTINRTPVTATFFSGSLSSSGGFTATLTDTSTLDQTGATWCFRIAPNASSPSGGTCIPVTGATPNLSTSLSASVKAPRFPPGASSYGYADAEVSPSPVDGAQYFNVTCGCVRSYSAKTGTWTGSASGGGTTPVCTQSITNTATDIGAQINAAVAALGATGGVICIGPGTYTMSTTATIAAINISLVGAGPQSTIFNCTVAGDCLVIFPPLFNVTKHDVIGATLSNFSIYGNQATGQIPIHTKDMIGWYLANLSFGGAGAGMACILISNVNQFTESNVSVNVNWGDNCPIGVELYHNPALPFQPGSFGYNNFQFRGVANTGQIGLWMTTNMELYNGTLNLQIANTGGTSVQIDSGVVIPNVANEYINLNTEDFAPGGGVIWNVASTNTHFNGWVNNLGVATGTAYSSNFTVGEVYKFDQSNPAQTVVNSATGSFAQGSASYTPNIAGTMINPFGMSLTNNHAGFFAWDDVHTQGFLGAWGGSSNNIAWGVNGDVYFPGSTAAVGQAACITTNEQLGHCTSAVSAGGACTCVAK